MGMAHTCRLRGGDRHPRPRMLAVLVIALVLNVVCPGTLVAAASLTVLVQPVTSVAGEPLALQPSVALTDDDGNILRTINTGTIRVEIGINPLQYATLSPVGNSFPFANGIAKCSGLSINLATPGYTLMIISMYHNVRVETTVFDIITGARHSIAIIADISTAYGGTLFRPQPTAAIVDKGGNIVGTLNTGTVRLEIVANPVNGHLLPGSKLNVTIFGGVAKFQSLYIDISGSPYVLQYTTDVELPGAMSVRTNPFTVAEGSCDALVLQRAPTEATGGRAFSIQPVLYLIDAGNNVLSSDSTSYLRVRIASNPSGGTIAPSESLTAPVRRGFAVFRSLRIDRAGNNYALAFTLYTKATDRDVWSKAGVEVLSPPFNVAVGMPVSLSLTRPLSDGVLDGQPIEVQPVLQLLDTGGNVASDVVTGVVTASMVPSASIASTIVIDTTAAPAVTVVSVTVLATSGFASPFGVGMRLVFQVVFSDEVRVTGAPTLLLASAPLIANYGAAECVTVFLWAREIAFQYDVVATDTTSDLEYASTTALQLNGGAIEDRNARAASLALPALGSTGSLATTSDVAIETSAPVIVSVSCGTPGDGDYGRGEHIYLHVLFSARVAVMRLTDTNTQLPTLPVVLATVGGGAAVRSAVFASGNTTDTLVFLYVVQSGDATGLGSRLDVQTTIQLPTGITIKRYSSRSTTDADLTMVVAPHNLASMNVVTIDTSIPTVDASVGVTAITSDGEYTPGDTLELAVTFTKPVRVHGIPWLLLETGSIIRPAGYTRGSGSKTLVFTYIVSAYDTHSATGLTALNYRDASAINLNGGFIRRWLDCDTGKPASAASDAVSADLSLAATSAAGRALKDTAQLTLNGWPATVATVSATQAQGKTTVVRGDVVTLTVSFSSRVSVNTTLGTPAITMSVGEYYRRAFYVSGSGSQALSFAYTVSLGDHAESGIAYSSTTALALNGATIRKTSANPSMDAHLTLPSPAFTALATPPIVVDRGMGLETKVVGFTAPTTPAGEYGIKHVIALTITFSEEVGVQGQPVLTLNTGALVPYVTGAGTSSLVFYYVVPESESTTGTVEGVLNKMSDDAILCDPPECRIINYNAELATITLAGIDLVPAGIIIDTRTPVVVDVYALTAPVTVNDGAFAVGDAIEIVVEMNLEVFIDPPTSAYPEKAPILLLATGATNPERSVLCVGYYQGNRKKLLFRYVVQRGDVTSDLTYVDASALTLNSGQCAIKRFSTTPTMDASIELPMPPPSLGAKLSGVPLRVDATREPVVLEVNSLSADGVYRCGDHMYITITFSLHVVVTGTPVLWLDLGEVSRTATYVSGSGSTVLTFKYVVQDGDYSVNLEYVDHHSLDTGGSDSTIQLLATTPTTFALLDLPYPFTEHSLSFTTDLTIDGRRPTITAATFLTPDGTYGVGSVIMLQLTFSSCVTVDIPDNGTVPRVVFHPVPVDSTAVVTRYAYYTSGSPGTQLRFKYTVQTGDTASDLDYADAHALALNGARILTCTSDLANVPPVQPVDTHLNPPGGLLWGDTEQPITFGVVAFTDLLVDRLGFEYAVMFRTQFGAATLTAVSLFNVVYSAAYGLRSVPFASGDSLGSSVDVSGDTLVLGAPHAKEAISAVQIVTALGDADSYEDEVQVVTTSATQRPAVQQLTSTAAPGESVGGWFYLKMGGVGPTRRIYSNFDEIQLAVALELDLGFGHNTIRVTRTENTYCACDGAFTWSITFLYVTGELPVLQVVNPALTGRSASVGDGRGNAAAEVIVDATLIGGSFALQTSSVSTGVLLTTANIPSAVSGDELANIINQYLLLTVRRVTRSPPSPMGGYSWSITFVASDTLYDVPELTALTTSKLLGFEAKCTIRTERQGRGRLSGFFRLQFRSDIFPHNAETENIALTASDHDMEQALEQLLAINDVSVQRSTAMNAYGGYSWAITFVQVNTKNAYGPVVDTSGTLPSLVAVTSTQDTGPLLKGTNARIAIQVGGYSLDRTTANAISGQDPMSSVTTFAGLPGDDAGNVVLFYRTEAVTWKQQGSTLSGIDTRAGDNFGTSVSLDNASGRLLVGAPSAALYGDYESQNLLCDADGGFLKLIFRGKQSDAIPFNANAETLQRAIVTILSATYAEVEIATRFSALCSANNLNEISIVLRTNDQNDANGDIALIGVDISHLTKKDAIDETIIRAGFAEMREYRTGTFRRDGINSKGIQVGASYIFVRNSVAGTWTQQAKLTPPASMILNDVREFGASVALNAEYAVVGAPGALLNEGRVFVYSSVTAASWTWSLFQILSAAPYVISQGDRFGETVAVSRSSTLGDAQSVTVTIVVGAPGYASASGAVFVYNLVNGQFQNRQAILHVAPVVSMPGARFGSSVDLDLVTTFTLVVGAVASTTVNTIDGNMAKGDDVDSGRVLVFVRRSANDMFFVLQQVLQASDARAHDRFGLSVAVAKDTVLVGAHVRYQGPRTIRKPVQSITTNVKFMTSSNTAHISGGTFQLSFRQVNTDLERVVTTRTTPIAFNVDASSLRVHLESTWPSLGKILVSRDGPNILTNGYTWHLTFTGSNNDLPLLEIDGRGLVVKNGSAAEASVAASDIDVNTVQAMVAVRWKVRSAPVLRGNTYVFTRNQDGLWTEQATLYPRAKQYFSWFGSSVALDDRTAIIGAPNLDTYESGINSGGGFVYDLGILSLGFSSPVYDVVEGSSMKVKVDRCSSSTRFCAMDVTKSPRLFVNYDTGDAYSDLSSENFVSVTPHIGPYRRLSQLEAPTLISSSSSTTSTFFAASVATQEPFPQSPYGRWLVANHIGTANSRNQFYGSTDECRSLWIDANFDYAGTSDYMTSTGELYFDVEDTSLTFPVYTTSDRVLEDPDETIPLRLSLPGVWPSFGGALWSTLTIKDDGDGGSGTRSSLAFLTANTPESESDFSSTVSVFESGNVAIVGAPSERHAATGINANGDVACGGAHLYVRRSGFWEPDTTLVPSVCQNGVRFGASVSVDGSMGIVWAIVGAPGIASAFVYRRDTTTGEWSLEATLTDPTGEAHEPSHGFAGPRGVSLWGNVAVVAASKLERVYVYHRTTPTGWEFIKLLYASDRVVTRILEQSMMQEYRFGAALKVNCRTIAVGAPFGDAGAFTAEQYYDPSFDRRFFGKGAVYLFHMQAQVQTVALRTNDPLISGSFQLAVTHRDVTTTTAKLSYMATATVVKAALQALSNVFLVEVTRQGSIDKGFTWSVTFVGAVLHVSKMTALWKGYGCTDCVAFSSVYTADPASQLLINDLTSIGTWVQQARVVAPDGNLGDRFGASVALSGEQLIVGAPGSSALTTTSWGFETGDLTGWLTTGTAFDSQPTYGDNTYARINPYRFRPSSAAAKLEQAGERAGHVGRYWVGTYESRRGAGKVTSVISACAFASDALCNQPYFQLPGPDPAGSYQGDEPQGTLTSQPFTIQGPWLSFRLGGGCDINSIYVELLVEGASVLKNTGDCSEAMAVVTWNLEPYLNQTAQIRVVDASSSVRWGHINFDDVLFSWDVSQTTTPNAGVAYAFRRKAPGAINRDACVAMNRATCEWEFQTRLLASDKHSEDRFGEDVAIDDSSGVAFVGAPGQRAVDANNSIILMDPLHDFTAGGVPRPKHGHRHSIDRVGSVYSFTRTNEIRDGNGILLSPPRWAPKEVAKLQFPKKQAHAQFGSSLDLSQDTLVVGAPGFTTSVLTPQSGQAFIYDAAFTSVRFTKSEFACQEGNAAGLVSLVISRSSTKLALPLTIGFATEDVTARAVDALHFTACQQISIAQRRNCFDYQQTAGEITFAVGESSKLITVPIMDDTCYEVRPEHFIVRLNVPGGEVLIGEQYVARVRIDDDDFAYDPC